MRSSSEFRTDIVIVNWNSGEFLKNCLESLEDIASVYIGNVIVVDNNSSDQSHLAYSGNLDVVLRNAGANLGFAKACNIGSELGNSPFILFLNPDVELRRDSLKLAIEFLSSAENYAACGIQLSGRDGNPQLSCARFPRLQHFFCDAVGLARLPFFRGTHLTEFDHQSNRDVDHVIGAFYLVRRKAFSQVDGFDTDFFVYMEDLDLSLRLHQQGFKIYYLADAKAFHEGGGTSKAVIGHRLFYSRRSKIIYSSKHFGRISSLLTATLFLLIEPLVRLPVGILMRGHSITSLLGGYAKLWSWYLRREKSELRMSG